MKALAFVFALFLGNVSFAHPGHDHGDPGNMAHLVFANGAVHAHATWIKGPQPSEESALRIEWKNGKDHSPLNLQGTFGVSLWMPDMGHGSAPTKITPVLDANGQPVVGAYDVTNMYFVMGGAWQVNVTLTLPNGQPETQTINVEIEDAGGGHHHQH
jgi:hypothetical protein